MGRGGFANTWDGVVVLLLFFYAAGLHGGRLLFVLPQKQQVGEEARSISIVTKIG